MRSLLQQLLLVTVAAGIGSAATASGTVPFSFFGTTSNTPGALVPGTVFTVPAVLVSSDGTGSFNFCPAPDCVAILSTAGYTPTSFAGNDLANAGGPGIGLFLDFGPGMRYRYEVTSQSAPIIIPSGTETTFNIFTLGEFTDSAIPGFDDSPASLAFAFTESCVQGGCSISGSAAFSTPPPGVPEPGTWVLLGSGLLAAAFAKRRFIKA